MSDKTTRSYGFLKSEVAVDDLSAILGHLNGREIFTVHEGKKTAVFIRGYMLVAKHKGAADAQKEICNDVMNDAVRMYLRYHSLQELHQWFNAYKKK